MIGFYAAVEGIPENINALEDTQRKLACAKLPMANMQLLCHCVCGCSGLQPLPTHN